MTKAFLGMGLLGSNFVKAMRRKGDDVRVWNRTAERAAVLETEGAKAFVDVVEAVAGADLVHVTLKDDASVDDVLAKAEAGFKPGVVIIDHTTTSAQGAIERTAAWKAKGINYLHAPVFMGPPNALESTGFMLVSGDQQVISKVLPEISKMTGKVLNLGEEEGKAAVLKLTGNSFLLSLTSGLSDALAVAKAHGVGAADVLALFQEFNPGAGMPARLKRITEGNFDQPSWELAMARKDAGLMIGAAEAAGLHLMLLPAIAAEMDKWIDAGNAKRDWSVIASNNIK